MGRKRRHSKRGCGHGQHHNGGDHVNEGTQRLLIGYAMTTILCVAMLWKDGELAMGATVAAAAAGAGLGQVLSKKV